MAAVTAKPLWLIFERTNVPLTCDGCGLDIPKGDKILWNEEGEVNEYGRAFCYTCCEWIASQLGYLDPEDLIRASQDAGETGLHLKITPRDIRGIVEIDGPEDDGTPD